MNERGVMLRSLREGIDYSTAVGRMVAGIFAALAEYERELIHERAAVARQAARARGKQTGRPRALTPDQRVEDRIRHAKNTGIEHLPSKSYEINQAWRVAAMIACDLLCWPRLLCLDGPRAKAEPKTLRYRLLHTALFPDALSNVILVV